MAFRPQESLEKAQSLEAQGQLVLAAAEYTVLSVYYRRKRKPAEALRMITRAQALTPDNPKLWVHRSLCELLIERPDEARRWIEEYALRARQEGEIDSFLNYLNQSTEEAFPELCRAFTERLAAPIVLEPLTSKNPPSLPRTENLGDLVRDLERELDLETERSATEIDDLIRRFRTGAEKVLAAHPKTRVDLACAFYEMGRIEEALAELAAIDTMSPLYAEASCLRGSLLVEQGQNVAALGVFNECIRTARENLAVKKEALYQSSRLLIRLSDESLARERLQMLEKLDSNYRDSAQLRRLLETGRKR